MQSIYVDDVVSGVDCDDDAYTLYKTSKEILSHASFNLRKFATNSSTLQDRINREEPPQKINSSQQINLPHVEALEESYVEATLPTEITNGPGEQRILGICWRVQLDQLVFEFSGIASAAALLMLTKRNVISIIGRFYDPLGFISPVTIRFKVFMQELCRSKLSWDQSLEGKVLGKWHNLVNDLTRGQPVVIPRCFLGDVRDTMNQYQLYGFCDASIAAYAAVIYLIEEDSDDKRSSFIVSKT